MVVQISLDAVKSRLDNVLIESPLSPAGASDSGGCEMGFNLPPGVVTRDIPGEDSSWPQVKPRRDGELERLLRNGPREWPADAKPNGLLLGSVTLDDAVLPCLYEPASEDQCSPQPWYVALGATWVSTEHFSAAQNDIWGLEIAENELDAAADDEYHHAVSLAEERA